MSKMSWLPLGWSADIKKRACRYLLQRYLGQFLEELTLDQLTVDLYNGTGRVVNVSLDVQALNEMGEQQHLPLEFVDGFIMEISLSIPWSALLSQASYVEVKGLRLTVQPRQRIETGTSMFESMWSSMTSSMQLAKECLQQDAANAGNAQPLDSVEQFAKTIDSILSRVKVRFIDTVIRLEHVPLNSSTGVAIEVWIQNLEYSDEAGLDPSNTSLDLDESAKGYIVSAFSTKRFYMEGVTFHIDEFPSRARTFSRSMLSSTCSTPDSKNSDSLFISAQMSPTQSILHTPPEGNAANNSNESNPIMFAKLAGRQEVRLKMKQGEGISGPKVELEITLGSLTLFLSPRQLHVLLELAHGLASPDLEDVSNVVPRRYTEKPMASSDFNRIEHELIHQTHPMQDLKTTDLRYAQGWSTGSVDESDNEDEFLPMKLPSSSMCDSITSNNFSMEGSISSSISSKSSATNLPKHNRHRHNIDNDTSAETTQFHIRVSSVALVLLHEDILTSCVEQLGLTSSSVRQMKNAAKEFFRQLGTFAVGGYGSKDFDTASKLLTEACQLSHIRLLAAPLVVEGSEKTTNQYAVISGSLTLASLEIIECLVDSNNSNLYKTPSVEFVELLAFTKENVTNIGFSNKTDFRMRFKYTQKAVRHTHMTKFAHPRTEFDIQMEPCKGEIDITIVDRISAILNPQPICNPIINARDANQQTLFDQAVDSATLPDSRIDIKISSSSCTIKLRFPVPDLRPLHDMSRAPWWKRSVRSDYMIVHMTNAQVHSTMDSRSHYLARHELQCRRLSLLYVETEGDTPIEIGLATVDEKNDATSNQQVSDDLGWARVVITVYPERLGAPLEDSSEEEIENDKRILDDTLEKTPKHAPSPFTSRRIMRESDTLHSKSHEHGQKNEQSDGEELIIPGNRQEMLEFIEEGIHGSRLQLEINLPCASVQIPSKRIYEQLYNRFNTDLFLWEPSAPRPKYTTHMENHIGLDLASTLLQESTYPKFSMCKSGIQYNSDSDSDEGSVLHSTTNEKTHKEARMSKKAQSKLAMTLSINQGLLSMYTPVRDSMRNVIPGQQGELIIRLEDATIFSVTAYKGNTNLSYACAMMKSVSLDHCGLTTSPSLTPPLRCINSIRPRYCERTIYRSESGSNITASLSDKDMMTVALKIQAAHQTHRIKTFRVAIGISDATLRHRMCSTATSWFTELIDCLDVADHPVAGYTPPGVLTELHLHLWDCAIDYRPLHLPLKSIVTLGNFSVSSNITAQTNTSTLRFIAEDVALFISDKLREKSVDLKRHYVCVMNFGLFELSLRLNERMYGGVPRVDLRASNNVLHVRTCSDSGRALMQLLTYIANDGDLQQSSNTINSSTENISTVPPMPTKYEENLLGVESINTLSRSQVERVYSLMEDALEETVKGTTTESGNESEKIPMSENRVEFFFPDDSCAATREAETRKSSQECGKVIACRMEDDEDDDEFCILGEEAGTGIIPRYGVPEVRSLCQEPLRIVDNHFSVPVGKTDLLQTPANYPAPVLKYTLCEMTLIWHMYGGNDFDNSQPQSAKHVTINDNVRSNIMHGRSRSAIGAVGFNKSSPNEVHFGSVPNSPRATRNNESLIDWHTLGGSGRRHDVLMELQLSKVRFQHEVYPENTREASRQVLLVHEIEVRDRLASSHINKFLYQYSSEAKPRQSHSIMFTMKAVHVRPDPRLSAQECCLKLSLLPLRLNIDQDSLLFLIQFFNELGGGSKRSQESSSTPNSSQSTPVSKQGTPTHHPPIMSVNDDALTNDAMMNMSQNIIDQNLLILLEDELTFRENKTKTKTIHQVHDDSQPIYFRNVIFGPEVLIRLDYHGKRMDFTHGPLAGLLMGLAELNCSELRLKRLSYRHGLLGYDKLFTYLVSEWLQDIKKNQLPSLLGGVGPMYSVVQLFQGIRDLFWLPIEQYQRDGRIVRGLQRGANSFTTCTAMAALELTCRIVQALQTTAETAYDIVSPGPSVRCKNKGQKGRRKRYSQPLDIREGVANAYTLVKEGLGETATQLVRVASEEHEHKGTVGAVGGVLRQIPPTVVKPIILATEATSNVLGGMRSSLVPDARREAVQKWRQDSDTC
ncbi:autophagy-related protein 2 homolog B-like [Monomorium pharaonis]|uniref:autophagy-related protein 2 homolog B n=1 Tax=Monomorium pharaonis TaxID=307658 RepID=UPI00063EE903|nr:autophagy-related protein 2 homolog B [Monomorium pharaonis]XP_012533982.1 autophagy-related protein 2 homolog B [Monomorium pharaonis]XP_036145533.1 autophagy-related protein 2 homolog B-like [Monomorium pharaonis]XP_036145534.1 autophagy-related protein 2 homolog B-like [Monomorium pharaonis]